MKRFAANILIITLGLLVSSCGVVGVGKSASPPAGGINAIAGDGRVTVSWVADPNVQYWMTYSTDANAITATNPSSFPGGAILMNVNSPLVVAGLVNGATYYFAMTGRIDGGPGGTATPTVASTPRLAGVAPAPWNSAAAVGASDLRGATFGAVFVSVGAGGSAFSSVNGITWTPVTVPVASDLNAVRYSAGTYMAAGAGGVLLSSTDAQNWQVASSVTANNLNGVASNGGGTFIAVGANGTIVESAGTTTWTVLTSGTSNNLNAITYAGGRMVAVGAGGVILTSADATTWTAVASGTSLDLNGVTYAATQFVAVGAAGTVLTSPDGLTWTAQRAITNNNLSAVTFGTQLVAVGAGGSIFTSPDGITWTAQASGTTNGLKAVTSGNGGYAAVGTSGTNLTAF